MKSASPRFQPQLNLVITWAGGATEESPLGQLRQQTMALLRWLIPGLEGWFWEFPVAQVLKLHCYSAPLSKSFLCFCQEMIEGYQADFQQGQAYFAHFDPPEILGFSADQDTYSLPFLFLPCLYQGQYLGGMCLGHPGPPMWHQQQLQPLQIIVEQYSLGYTLAQSSPAASLGTMALDLSHLHHELRTPLTGILGFSKMLKEELYGPLNDKQRQYVQGILLSGEHLLSLVNDFLDLAKIDARREELFLEVVAVEDLCWAALSMVQINAREKGLDLKLEIAPEVDFCRVDQKRVKQILLNLLSNAIKFTLEGGVTLRVERQGEFLTLAVIDTGIGIEAADQAQLFQPFKQLKHPLNRQTKGTGLGLVLSRKLAQLHGGDIYLESCPGQGSCFTLQLPLENLGSADESEA
ncbi:HAMP domain-containing sensor histidine kinase [Synechocystis sp. LKSZ1]|uniref:sensor histidine kinase n=1 Tax=Synechocystis sp. LKSZ1 TaxID=3144951 RepID=UPI00336BD864